ncbi:MAG: elongation factor G [Anaerolineae bacterium]
MKPYPADRLRNVVLLSHGGAGKTTLSEALLFKSGAIDRMGSVAEGNTVSDHDDEEIRRQISVSTSVIPCEWEGHKINLLDTPGYADFVGEVRGATRVADSAVVVVDAVAGVEVGTELVWGYAKERDLPGLVWINKLDRENANFEAALEQVSERFATTVVPILMPIGAEDEFTGVIDLVAMSSYVGEADKSGDVPEELVDRAQAYRQELMEAAAEADDELMLKYLDGVDLEPAEIATGLKAGLEAGKVVLVLSGSADQGVGARQLLDAMITYLPAASSSHVSGANPATGATEALSPEPDAPLAALVFKTLADPYVGKLSYFRVYSGSLASDSRALNSRANEEERIGQVFYLRGKEQIKAEAIGTGDIGAVPKLGHTATGDTLCDTDHPIVLPDIALQEPVYSVAISPKTKADLDKMGGSLERMLEEDPTLGVRREPDTGETLLSGMGDSHIEIAARRLHAKFGVEITTQLPKIPYRETIRQSSEAEGKYKKQTGGRGQYGIVQLRLEPRSRGEGFEFVDKIFGGAIPKNFIPAVQKGLVEALGTGVLAGYPATDLRAVLFDGKYHTVDSSEIAFKIAASLGFKAAMEKADPVLLEPIMNVSITVPESATGDVLGDLNTKRAKVQGMDQAGGAAVITAQAPLAEIQRYATDLRSITQGRGFFTMEFSHYEEVPPHIADSIAAEAKKDKRAKK